MTAVRIDVLGAAGAGRTTFVRTISEMTVLSTDPDAGDAAEDVGRITVDRDLVLHLVGGTGPGRAGGPALVGSVLLVDGAREDRLQEATSLLSALRSGEPRPYVVVGRPGDDPDRLRAVLGLGEREPLLQADARDRAAVKRVLLAVLQAAAAALVS